MEVKKIHLKPGDLPKKLRTHLYEKDKEYLEPTSGKVKIFLESSTEEILGPPGRLLSSSKSDYVARNQEALRAHKIYFNACIFDKDFREIWFGDLDLTKDTEKLQQAANLIGLIYVTHETPYRFDGLDERKAKADQTVLKIVKE